MKRQLRPYKMDIANQIHQGLFEEQLSISSMGRSTTNKLILEIMMEGGLDAMALSNDGVIKYINHSGRMSLLGSPNPLSIKCRRILKLADKKDFLSSKAQIDLSCQDYRKTILPKKGHARVTIFDKSGKSSYEDTLVSMSNNKNAKEVLFLCAILLHDITSLITNEPASSG